MTWKRVEKLIARVVSLTALCQAVLVAPFVVPGNLFEGILYAPLWAPPTSACPGEPNDAVGLLIWMYVVQSFLMAICAVFVFLVTMPTSFIREDTLRRERPKA